MHELFDALFGAADTYDLSRETAAAERAAGNARMEAQRARMGTAELEARLEKLMIVTEALWCFIRERHQLTDADLVKMVRKIDLKDGRLDGRVAKSPPAKCPSCGGTVQASARKCIYCGKDMVVGPFER